MARFKIVLMPVGVPDSKYCWDGKTVCDHFDNQYFTPECTMQHDIPGPRTKEGYYEKPDSCRILKEK